MVKIVLRWLDLVVYLAFVVFVVASGPRVTPWYVGLCLAAASVPPWFIARWQLGGAFSVRPEARHPVYVFGGLAWFGALLALLGWSAWVIGIFLVLVGAVRARREELVLEKAFGDEYLEYRSRTWF